MNQTKHTKRLKKTTIKKKTTNKKNNKPNKPNKYPTREVLFDNRPYCYTQYPWSPSPDNVRYFVGRDIELMGFWIQLSNLVGTGEEQHSNLAFIGQRKLGKTAYLKRCYNITFWEQEEVVPFYYSFAQDDEEDGRRMIQLADLQKEMPLVFLKQFFAFYTKDEKVVDLKTIDEFFDYFEEIEFPEKKRLMRGIKNSLDQINKSKDIFILRDIWELTQYLSLFVRKKCLLIIDEAQEMDISIYDGEEQIKSKNTIIDIIQKQHSLVIVSGSNVSMLVNNFLSYKMANRFSKIPFTPLERKDAKELVERKCSDGYYGLADDLWEYVQGNPYYINKILSFNMRYFKEYKQNKDFSTKESLDKAYHFEVLHSQGEILNFWQGHLKKNESDLNNDPKGKKGLTLQILYRIAKNPGKEFTYDELEQEFEVDEKTLREKTQQLENANLIAPTNILPFAYGFPDKVLSVIINEIYHKLLIKGPNKKLSQEAKKDYDQIRRKYHEVIDNTFITIEEAQKDIDDIHKKFCSMNLKRLQLKKSVKSAQGKMNLSKGISKENEVYEKIYKMIQNKQYMFADYKLNGSIHNININASHKTGCQIDLFAQFTKTDKNKDPLALLAEVKNYQHPITLTFARKFVSSVKAAIEKYDLEENNTVSVFISTSGFSKKAKELLEENDIVCSESEKIFINK